MHCPHCGQQQVSGEVRFCSRCGFPLGGVIELLANGGNLPVIRNEPEKGKRSQRYEGIRQGVILFLLGIVIVPLLGTINGFQGFEPSFLDLIVPLAAILFFVGGFVRILYSLIFEEGAPSINVQNAALPYVQPVAQAQFGAGVRAPALPPAQSIPVSNWRQRPNTAEIAHPPSVTENTTRLLNDPPEQNQR